MPDSPPQNATQRKIELQSPADLTHLHSLASRTASTRLATAFPGASDDELRTRVEALVTEFVDSTFAGVRANVTANGVDMKGNGKGGEDEEFEAFDAKLAERVRAAYERLEGATTRVADLRREGAGKASENWQKQWEAEDGMEEDKMEEEEVTLDVGPLRRWDDVRRTYERGTEGLVALKTGMATTAGRLEDAKKVTIELEGKGTRR